MTVYHCDIGGSASDQWTFYLAERRLKIMNPNSMCDLSSHAWQETKLRHTFSAPKRNSVLFTLKTRKCVAISVK